MLKASNINLSFKDKEILKGLDFTLDEKEIKLIYGYIGVGKSTLLYILSGLIGNWNGEVEWDDYKFNKVNSKLDKIRSDYMSVNFSNFFYIKDMPVEQNIIFPAIFAGRSKSYIDNRLEMIYDSFSDIMLTKTESISLKDFRSKKIGTMSNGQREIAMLARMLINETPYILADEMLRSFNTDVKKQMWTRLIEQFEIGKKSSLMLITHDDNMTKYPGVTSVYDFKDKKLVKRENKE
jgi:ABC-type lipoprotein export system ATPase subunit